MSKTDMGEMRDFDAFSLVADVDESQPYEVDQTSIYHDPSDGKFILAGAIGCSCWDGDWYATKYDTLDELLTDLGPKGTSDFQYNPSFAGAEDLARQAREWLALR